jgi:hypothetical protein
MPYRITNIGTLLMIKFKHFFEQGLLNPWLIAKEAGKT